MIRRRAPVLCVAVALLLAGCSGGDDEGTSPTTRPERSTTTTRTSADPAPAERFTGGDFYDPPDPLPAGRHGTLIRYEPIRSYDVQGAAAYRIMYRSVSVTGKPIAVTGTVLVPADDAPEGGRPIITVAHGTTGVADECAPSKDLKGSELALFGPAIEAGDLVAMTDYEGLGTPGVHPYLVGESEGRSVLDAARAAAQLPGADAGRDLGIAGYSQGGHGALWANQLAARWTPERRVVGTFAGAPASEVDVILAASPGLPVAGFGYLLVAGLHAAYPQADLSELLTPEGLTKLDKVNTGCTGEVIRAFLGSKASDLIKGSGAQSGEWAKLAKANDAGQVKTADPVLVVHSQQDNVVPITFSKILLDRMCATGQVVERRVLPDAGTHVQAAVPAYQIGLAWLQARFDGAAEPPVVDSCTAPVR